MVGGHPRPGASLGEVHLPTLIFLASFGGRSSEGLGGPGVEVPAKYLTEQVLASPPQAPTRGHHQGHVSSEAWPLGTFGDRVVSPGRLRPSGSLGVMLGLLPPCWTACTENYFFLHLLESSKIVVSNGIHMRFD